VSLLVSSCAAPASFVAPEVSLVNIRLSDVTMFESTAVFTVRVLNEGPRPMVLDGAVHRFSLNGILVGKGTSSHRIEIPRLKSRKEEITVHLRNASLVKFLRSVLAAGNVDYSVESRLYIPSRAGRLKQISTVSAGKFNLRLESERGGGWVARLEPKPD
jgi:LEA14-like dessication related protein